MTNLSLRWFLTIFLCGCFQLAEGQAHDDDIYVSDKAQFSLDENITRLKLVDGGAVYVEIGSVAKNRSDSTLSSEQPKFSDISIIQISISVNGKRVIVPKSAIDYLIDVNRCSIKHDKSGWALSIDGRDGAYGYFAVIDFDKTRVRRRAIYSDATKSHLMEETKYMPPPILK